MFFTFAFYDFRGGIDTENERYSMITLIGFFPALVIGLGYGIFLARNLDTEKET